MSSETGVMGSVISDAGAPDWIKVDVAEAPDVDAGEDVAEVAEGGVDVAAIEADAERGDRDEAPDDTGENPEESGDPETHTVKVDGEEFDVTLDELKAGYSRNRAATKRFQEASALKSQVQRFVGQLKSGDPEMVAELFGKIGVDFTKVAEAHITSLLDDLDMPADKRGMKQVEKERARLERERAEWQKQRQEASLEAESQREVQRYQSEMTAALGKAGLPANPTIVAKVARELEQALVAGHDMTTQEAVDLVVEDLRLAARRLPPAELRRLIGDPQQADAMKRQAAQTASAEQKRKRAAPATAAKRPASAQRAPAINPESLDAVRALFDS